MGLLFLPSQFAGIQPITYSYTDFQGSGGASKTVSGIYTMDTGEQILNVCIEPLTDLHTAAGALVTATLEVTSGSTVIGTYSLLNTAGLGTFFYGLSNKAATAQIDMKLTIVNLGGNLDNLDAGTGAIYLVIKRPFS